MREIMLVGLGSFIGGAARYQVGIWTIASMGAGRFPLGTFIVNAVGCLLIGLFSVVIENRGFDPQYRLVLVTGLLGGFTTFSAFGYETVNLLRSNDLAMAVCNIVASLCVCLLAVLAGLRIGAAV